MSDSYLDFANSALGSRIAAMLGLPQPVPLELLVHTEIDLETGRVAVRELDR